MSSMRRLIEIVESGAEPKSAHRVDEQRYPRKPTPDALAQAEAQGFDISTLYYHGTRRRFDGFRLPKTAGIDELGPGVYATSEKWLANTWARERGFILTVVRREGPLFDYAKVDTPETKEMLIRGYYAASNARWGQQDEPDHEFFDYVWRMSRDKPRLVNGCLSGAGYIGAYQHDSQISGQIVVFKPEDLLIVAREGGRNYMTSND